MPHSQALPSVPDLVSENRRLREETAKSLEQLNDVQTLLIVAEAEANYYRLQHLESEQRRKLSETPQAIGASTTNAATDAVSKFKAQDYQALHLQHTKLVKEFAALKQQYSGLQQQQQQHLEQQSDGRISKKTKVVHASASANAQTSASALAAVPAPTFVSTTEPAHASTTSALVTLPVSVSTTAPTHAPILAHVQEMERAPAPVQDRAVSTITAALRSLLPAVHDAVLRMHSYVVACTRNGSADSTANIIVATDRETNGYSPMSFHTMAAAVSNTPGASGGAFQPHPLLARISPNTHVTVSTPGHVQSHGRDRSEKCAGSAAGVAHLLDKGQTTGRALLTGSTGALLNSVLATYEQTLLHVEQEQVSSSPTVLFAALLPLARLLVSELGAIADAGTVGETCLVMFPLLQAFEAVFFLVAEVVGIAATAAVPDDSRGAWSSMRLPALSASSGGSTDAVLRRAWQHVQKGAAGIVADGEVSVKGNAHTENKKANKNPWVAGLNVVVEQAIRLVCDASPHLQRISCKDFSLKTDAAIVGIATPTSSDKQATSGARAAIGVPCSDVRPVVPSAESALVALLSAIWRSCPLIEAAGPTLGRADSPNSVKKSCNSSSAEDGTMHDDDTEDEASRGSSPREQGEAPCSRGTALFLKILLYREPAMSGGQESLPPLLVLLRRLRRNARARSVLMTLLQEILTDGDKSAVDRAFAVFTAGGRQGPHLRSPVPEMDIGDKVVASRVFSLWMSELLAPLQQVQQRLPSVDAVEEPGVREEQLQVMRLLQSLLRVHQGAFATLLLYESASAVLRTPGAAGNDGTEAPRRDQRDPSTGGSRSGSMASACRDSSHLDDGDHGSAASMRATLVHLVDVWSTVVRSFDGSGVPPTLLPGTALFYRAQLAVLVTGFLNDVARCVGPSAWRQHMAYLLEPIAVLLGRWDRTVRLHHDGLSMSGHSLCNLDVDA